MASRPGNQSLSAGQVASFVRDGFVRLDDAFPGALAHAARAILWAETGCDPEDPASWTRPVVWLGDHAQPPFAAAIQHPRLTGAIDQLVGIGRWLPRASIGTFPIRFPDGRDTGDTGWHIDVSFPGDGVDAGDYLHWRANAASRGRSLLLLMLFSDVGEADAPTRIRVGSHRTVVRMLAPFGDAGLSGSEIGARLADMPDGHVALATGAAGTVYLCHPHLAHAAQPHRGTRPRFLAQPPILPREPITLDRADGAYSPVERAIRDALA